MKCLYHANCNDGAGAALAVWAKYGDIGHDYIPCQYGNDLPDGLEGCDVVMVDFSAKKDQIRELARKAASILIIDHHKTAQAELNDVDDGYGCPIEVMFDMDKSGAVLAWEWFHPDKEVPELLKYIQDRDLWRFEFCETQDVAKGLQLHPNWRNWLTLDTGILADQGFSVNKFLEMQATKIVLNQPIEWEVTGDTVPVYNLPGFMISDTLHMALERHKDAPYAVAYFDLPEGKRIYSLRSRSGTEVDVSEIAKRLGGGGHKHAAGFSIQQS